MPKDSTGQPDDQLAADAEALGGQRRSETPEVALLEAIGRCRNDPELVARVRRIIERDRELLDRLAR